MIWDVIMAVAVTLMAAASPGGGKQGDMLSQLKRHEIQVLLRAGFAAGDVARRSGASEDTVRRIEAEAEVQHTDDAAARRERRVGRPSKAAPFAERVGAWLAEDSGLPTQELLRRAKEHGYSGNKTAFYALVAGMRPSRATPIVRFEGLPGEFSQHDFGHVDVKLSMDPRSESISSRLD